ncbi:MAG: phosphate acyltransferase PlsX [Christensenellaceae bacterium]|jgi:glycerol-3-phosphate acyltransferase PlsX|nr:phosphate acyltransferase PlsX [Christensenellaceae bacterium]
MLRVAVDALGGDHAPKSVVDGCLLALERDSELRIALCGPSEDLKALLKGKDYDFARLELIEAPDFISNHDSPTLAIRRKLNSSMVAAMDLLKNGEAQAFVSAGSTGAILAGGVFRVGRIKGIERPAIGAILPTLEGTPAMLIDSGANADARPEYLPQFALMGSSYMRGVLGIKRPKVGLLNVGAENEKGNELTKAAFPLLEAAPIDFYGNIEARDALGGAVQVIVADGFSGNIFLKGLEGTVSMLFALLKGALSEGILAKLGAALVYPKLKAMKKRLDYEEYGGAALLGVNGVMIKAHGSSNASAFSQAISQGASCARAGVARAIEEQLRLTLQG